MWLAGPAPSAAAVAPRGALRLGFDLKPGMRVGLYGGSFNPAHDGHAHVAETALAQLGLDRVIWLVSPQNPLKTRRPASLAARMAAVRRIARGRAMIVSDLEARLGARYTLDVIRSLKARYPGVRFVWLMGADNLASFHHWRGWTQIMRLTPMAVVARPGFVLRAALSVAARRFAGARAPAASGRTLADATPPAWILLTAPLNYASSSALRGAETSGGRKTS